MPNQYPIYSISAVLSARADGIVDYGQSSTLMRNVFGEFEKPKSIMLSAHPILVTAWGETPISIYSTIKTHGIVDKNATVIKIDNMLQNLLDYITSEEIRSKERLEDQKLAISQINDYCNSQQFRLKSALSRSS